MLLARSPMFIAAAALAVSLGAAQPISQARPAEPAADTEAQATEKPKPAATGIPECDKYFAVVEACIATKTLSKDDQKAAELNVSRLRAMLPIAKAPQGRATLVERCTASLEAAQKDGKYACYKPDPKAGGLDR